MNKGDPVAPKSVSRRDEVLSGGFEGALAEGYTKGRAVRDFKPPLQCGDIGEDAPDTGEGLGTGGSSGCSPIRTPACSATGGHTPDKIGVVVPDCGLRNCSQFRWA